MLLTTVKDRGSTGNNMFKMPLGSTTLTSMHKTVLLALLLVNVAPFVFTMNDFWQQRKGIIENERVLSVGGDIDLSEDEKIVNTLLLNLKKSELHKPDCAAFSQFLNIRSEIESSDVFGFIKRLPKGGSLHNHLFASASYNYIYNNLLKRDGLFLCETNGRTKLTFLVNDTEKCKRVSENIENVDFQKWLQNNMVLNSDDITKNFTQTWDKFKKIFTLTYDLFTYVHVFKDYVYQILLEHYDDNVLYLELKAPYVYLYELDGTTYDEEYFINTLYKINNEFKKKYPKFIGIKYICALYRKLDPEILITQLSKLKQLMKTFPNFIAGFDFVGFEGDAALTNYVEILQESDINFYFHAGETNNYGDTMDENLLDALLLGSKRIGHAFSASKHPELQKIIKENNTAIEVCPISNQVLKLVDDLRNHPASGYIASGLPIVICNDDPGNWGAEGLSYDWYMTFMAMTHKNAGLEFLKKISMNSILYSSMNTEEKIAALNLLEEQWKHFITETLLLYRK